MLYGLLNFDPGNRGSVEQWALWHSTDHAEIQEVIQKMTGQDLEILQLYPFALDKFDDWSLRHQTMHNDMNGVAGFAGNDLTGVDFKDVNSREEWHFKHFSEHRNIRAKYGI